MKKKLIFTIFSVLMLFNNLEAQVPQINGFWECSSTGNVFQVEGFNNGFRYKLTTNNNILTAGFVGNNFGFPTYRSDFSDGSFSLFMIKSLNEICTSNTNNPNILYTWKKQNGGYQENNQSVNNGLIQYLQLQHQTSNLIPGTSYLTKKRFLDTQKGTLKSQLERAERNQKEAPISSQTTYQFEIDRLNREINAIDMKILDLDQMKMRGELK